MDNNDSGDGLVYLLIVILCICLIVSIFNMSSKLDKIYSLLQEVLK